MNPVRLQFPLKTLDRRVLVPSGTSISRNFLKRFLQDLPKPSERLSPLFGHRRIEADLRDFCRENNCELKLAGLDETCRKILEITRLRDRFDCYAELAEAVKSFA